MNQSELSEILKLHKLWTNNDPKGIRANLRGANLQRANLRRADLQGANSREANLRGANLQGADLDFSCWPLWCGSSNVKIDEKQARQLLAHAFSASCQFWPGGLTEEQTTWLNKFHRIQSDEFPKIENKK